MSSREGAALRLRVCRVEARAEVTVVKLWGSLVEQICQQPPAQAALRVERRRPQAGELCMAEVGGRWLPCKVLWQRGDDYRVFLLRDGAAASVSPRQLSLAPAAMFSPLPQHQLVCAISGLVPPSGQHWNCRALHYFRSLQGQEVRGQVLDLILSQGLVLLEVYEVARWALLKGLAKTIPNAAFRALLDNSCLPLAAMEAADQRCSWQVASLNYYYPRLECGVTELVRVIQVSDPYNILCQLSSMSWEVKCLLDSMQRFYGMQTGCQDQTYPKPLEPGQPCASRGASGFWYRSLLLEYFPESWLAKVIHVDWGRKELVPISCLRTLAAEFFRMPVVTFRCALYRNSDGGMGWEPSLSAKLRSSLQGRQVSAKIEFYNSYERLYAVTLLEDGLNINHLFYVEVQKLKMSESDTSAALACLCSKEEGKKKDTRKIPEDAPKLSNVKLKPGNFYDATVEFIIDPLNFWVRTEEDTAKHKEMVNLIADVYSKTSRLDGIITKPTPGQICCAKFKDDTYRRAEIVAVDNKQVKVFFLDCGMVEMVNWYNVKGLPAKFKGVPALANRCRHVDIYPLGEAWSPEATLAFEALVAGKKLIIYVISNDADKYTIEVLDDSRIEEGNVGKILSSAGHAKYEEPEIVTDVHMREGGVNSQNQPVSDPEPGQQEASEELSTDNGVACSPYKDQLFQQGTTIDVTVSHVENPGVFWCQNTKQTFALKQLMSAIHMHCLSTNNAPEPQDLACLAKSPSNETWYRAFITGPKSNCVEVFYVDYGYKETIPIKNLCAMKSNFLHIKSYAFRCSLYNTIAPVGNDPFNWDTGATKAFRDFAQKEWEGSEFHCMFFAAACQDNERFNIVNLYTPFDNICSVLVNKGFARNLFHKTLAPSVQLQSFYYSSHGIKIGSEEEVVVTCVNPTLEFYCRLVKNTDTIERIEDAIVKACQKTPNLELPHSGPLCLAKLFDQEWSRGIICSLHSRTKVFFVDFGNTKKVDNGDLRPIMQSDQDLLLFPMQAIKCSLPDTPISVPEEIVTWFEDAVFDRPLRALVVAKEANGTLLVELYDGDEQINAALKSKLKLNVPKNVITCNASSQPAAQVIQQETKTVCIEPVTREGKTSESIHRLQTGGCNVPIHADFSGGCNVPNNKDFTGGCNVLNNKDFTGGCNVPNNTDLTGGCNVPNNKDLTGGCNVLNNKDFTGGCNVPNNTDLTGGCNVPNNKDFTGECNVPNNTDLTGGCNVPNNKDLTGGCNVPNNKDFTGECNVPNNKDFTRACNVPNNTDFTGECNVPNNTDFTGGCNVPNNKDFTGECNVPNNTDFTGECNVPNNKDFTGGCNVPNNKDFTGECNVPNNKDFTGECNVHNNKDFTGGCNVPNNTDLTGECNVPNNTDLTGGCNVPNNKDLTGGCNVPNNKDFTGECNVPNNKDFTGECNVPNNTDLTGGCNVPNNKDLTGGCNVPNNKDFTGECNVPNNKDFTRACNVPNNTDFTGECNVPNNTDFTGGCNVPNNKDFTGECNVPNNTDFTGECNVPNNKDFTGGCNVPNNKDFTGECNVPNNKDFTGECNVPNNKDFTGECNVPNNKDFTGECNVPNNTDFTGEFNVPNNKDFTGECNVPNNKDFTGECNVPNNTDFTGECNVPNNKDFTGECNVPNNKDFTGECNVPNNKDFTGGCNVPNNKDFTGGCNVPNNKDFTGECNVPNNKDFTGECNVPNNKDFTGECNVPNNKDFTGECNVPNNKDFTGECNVPNNKDFTGECNVPNNKDFTGECNVPNNKDFTRECNVPNNKDFTGECNVPNNKDFTGKCNVPNNTDFTGECNVPNNKDFTGGCNVPNNKDFTGGCNVPNNKDFTGGCNVPNNKDFTGGCNVPNNKDFTGGVNVPNNKVFTGGCNVPNINTDFNGGLNIPNNTDFTGGCNVPNNKDFTGGCNVPNNKDFTGGVNVPNNKDLTGGCNVPNINTDFNGGLNIPNNTDFTV
ncbi:tudor domain-containing protein 6 [Mantella aurantiaca]